MISLFVGASLRAASLGLAEPIMAQIPQEASRTAFSRIVNFLYVSVADIAFFIAILFAVGFVLLAPIDKVPYTCAEALAEDSADSSVCQSTQRHGSQALQRLLETVSAEVH
ncbi:hypothetical protein IVB22_14380 [Bradyrhizobium sp. 190]|uniref:hypothetical protein n=1 Tax=unclassified Bradyrhizobium TaxID=2631580 RepID=UPI001FF79860|nr:MULTISPECIES: hypothetical protein [unclassified Bradyrhizobium]MCK1513736.1 hypothetical protein [Bradyrhizobium sp. 190]UPK05716.1 hypothetical protein IVB05_09025 [Bradyrhizobium sp. 170]